MCLSLSYGVHLRWPLGRRRAAGRTHAPYGSHGSFEPALELTYAHSVERCPFCAVMPDRIWTENEAATAMPDAYPIADGHTVIVPKRHVSTIYQLTASEQSAIWAFVAEIRERLVIGLRPDGFSIGFSGTGDGCVAGSIWPFTSHREGATIASDSGPAWSGCRTTACLDGRSKPCHRPHQTIKSGSW